METHKDTAGDGSQITKETSTRAATIRDWNSDELVEQGNQAYSRREYDAALKLFLTAVQVDGSHDSLFNAGNAAMQLSEYETAAALFELASEFGVAGANYNLSEALWRAGHADRASKVLKDDVESGDIKAALALAELQDISGEFDDALALYQLALSLHETRLARSDLYMKLGRYDDAVEDLRYSQTSDYRQELGMVLLRLGQVDEAASIFGDLLENGDSSGALVLSNIQRQSGDVGRALRTLRASLALGQKGCYLLIGEILEELGAVDAALSEYELGAAAGDAAAQAQVDRLR